MVTLLFGEYSNPYKEGLSHKYPKPLQEGVIPQISQIPISYFSTYSKLTHVNYAHLAY